MEFKKITVIGDIMSEPSLFAQAATKDGYDYHFAFDGLRSILEDSDYCIGNLETPVAGEELGYTASLVSFNTPEAILQALKDIGIDALTLANNHSLDRGYRGMLNTIDAVERYGFTHTGCYRTPDEKNRILYAQVGDTKIAVISYTYRTNGFRNPDTTLTPENFRCINYLLPYEGYYSLPAMPEVYKNIRALIKEDTGAELSWEGGIRLKKALGIPVDYADDYFHAEDCGQMLEYIREDIEEAKKNADLVIFMPHCGGQFNVRPGSFSSYIINEVQKMNPDVIIAAHSHTTQKGVMNPLPTFYSIGNVSMSPNSNYAVRESLPDYGLAVNLYVGGGKLFKVTYSIFRMYEPAGEKLRVIPVTELNKLLKGEEHDRLLREVKAVYERVSRVAPENDENFEIRAEYEL